MAVPTAVFTVIVATVSSQSTAVGMGRRKVRLYPR
jgi:hypothetical protein